MAKHFRPITARPGNTESYVEIPPCTILKPYIRCFWGSPEPITTFNEDTNSPQSSIVIPDACMDIIFQVDYLNNNISCNFYGINDKAFYIRESAKTTLKSTFGIRFNFWAVALFSDMGMKRALNCCADSEEYFHDFKKKLEAILIEKPSIKERIMIVEKYLIERLYKNHSRNDNVMNAIYYILKEKGVIQISDLSRKTAVSQRQLERIFMEHIGVTPKKTVDLVRFQNVWQELYYAREKDFQEIVYKYGYSDQPHLINSFKRYAGRSPLEALLHAK